MLLLFAVIFLKYRDYIAVPHKNDKLVINDIVLLSPV